MSNRSPSTIGYGLAELAGKRSAFANTSSAHSLHGVRALHSARCPRHVSRCFSDGIPIGFTCSRSIQGSQKLGQCKPCSSMEKKPHRGATLLFGPQGPQRADLQHVMGGVVPTDSGTLHRLTRFDRAKRSNN